ncbi:MAG TPA: PAS domain S-box protein, partial [Candidatus Nanopelagicales bacterium]|nr:PAS domain S-box protein [Candidatus Nanopelagicales bacterium]
MQFPVDLDDRDNPERQKMPHRSPEVWRTACQDMARRAQGGTLIYPFAVALLGVGSDRQGAFPAIFLALLALVTLLAFFRFFLCRRFERLYDRDPRRWAIAFFGGALATCAAFSGLLYFQIHQNGLTPYTLFAVIAAMGIAAMAIVLYAPSLGTTWAYILLLGLPLTVALARTEGPSNRWIAWCIAIAVVYLLGVAWQQHHERWAGLALRHQLVERAAALERAQVELQQGREELERLVEERTRALEKTSEDYRQIFESAHDAIIVFRPEDERVLNVNRRACEIYGFTREEFLQISLASISENVARGQ